MSETKGPIETIREACEQWRKGLWDGGTREAITQACDALDKERVTLNQLTAFVVLLTDANRMTIAHALDLQGGTLNGGSVDTGERLTAICREWAQQARKRTKPYGFDFDDADHSAVEKAIAKRATMDAMPKSLSCERGALLAEICRDWLERVEHDERRTDRIDNGEVTVWQPPASLKAGEYWWDGYGLYYVQVESVNRIPSHAMADWTNPPKPGRYKVPGGGKPATWEGDA